MANAEVRNLYSLLNIIMEIKSKKMRWGGYVAHERDKIQNFSQPERKRPFGRPGNR
jgi:hypothetical protein